MLNCCIRREPMLIDDECETSSKNGRRYVLPLFVKDKQATVKPVTTQDFMIDLEAGLNHQNFVVYTPRPMNGSAWVHGTRLAI